jgi:mRNA-degrading endonuclease RelE of RelBE toxin-antitoxin system
MYLLVWDEMAKVELKALRAFDRKIVVDAIETQLRHQPHVETTHRKPLRGPVPGLPEATWELRVHGVWRVLYMIGNERTVTLLRVIIKDTATLDYRVGRGRKP